MQTEKNHDAKVFRNIVRIRIKMRIYQISGPNTINNTRYKHI